MTVIPVSSHELSIAREERGPRYFVSYSVGNRRSGYTYCDTAEAADEAAERYRQDYRQVVVTPPSDLTPLVELTRQLAGERRKAIEAEREASNKLKAATVRLVNMGTSEPQAAAIADVDRMTVRKWCGKR